MVTQVTSLSRSGLADFVAQRASAVVLALYTLCLLAFFLANPGMTHTVLVAFLGHPAMQVFNLLALLATAAHAWIGLWTVGTDYLQPRHIGAGATALRLMWHATGALLLVVYLWWGLGVFLGLAG